MTYTESTRVCFDLFFCILPMIVNVTTSQGSILAFHGVEELEGNDRLYIDMSAKPPYDNTVSWEDWICDYGSVANGDSDDSKEKRKKYVREKAIQFFSRDYADCLGILVEYAHQLIRGNIKIGEFEVKKDDISFLVDKNSGHALLVLTRSKYYLIFEQTTVGGTKPFCLYMKRDGNPLCVIVSKQPSTKREYLLTLDDTVGNAFDRLKEINLNHSTYHFQNNYVKTFDDIFTQAVDFLVCDHGCLVLGKGKKATKDYSLCYKGDKCDIKFINSQPESKLVLKNSPGDYFDPYMSALMRDPTTKGLAKLFYEAKLVNLSFSDFLTIVEKLKKDVRDEFIILVRNQLN